MDIKIVKKRIKNINIKVKPNCDIILTVPLGTKDEYIDYILERRKGWIEKKIKYFKENQPSVKEYVSGEDFYYLGKRYRLKVIIQDDINHFIKLKKGYLELHININNNNFVDKERFIYSWYYEKAEKYFLKTLNRLNEQTVKKEVKIIRIKKMKTRWGSCNFKKHYINLNIELIKNRKEFIEYVILHELTHLIYPNHSKEFYNYIATYMPNWKERKKMII